MKIITTDYSMATRSYDIFFSGCKANPRCKDCHNPESWDFSFGVDWREKQDKIKADLETFSSVIDKVFILGGEPLDQDECEFLLFLDWLRELNKEIWLFTRFELEEIPVYIKSRVDYIKTGRYKPELSTNDNVQFGVRLATSNQNIYKMDDCD